MPGAGAGPDRDARREVGSSITLWHMGAVLAALIGLAVLAGLVYGVTGYTPARYAAMFFAGLTAAAVLGLMFLLPIS